MADSSRVALAACLAGLLPACRESLEVGRDRLAEKLLTSQIADLQTLIARVESGQLVTQDRIAIGLSEEAARELLDASLPQERVVAERLLVRIDAVQPLFRGGSAAVVFQGTATGLTTGVSARVELGGRLVSFRIEKGRLVAGAEVIHFKALDTSLGGAGSALLERLLRDSLAELSRSLPALEIPVHLEQSIEIAGLAEGVVVAQPGVLPFQMTLTDVIPVDERLWILLEAKAGPWRRNPGGKKDE